MTSSRMFSLEDNVATSCCYWRNDQDSCKWKLIPRSEQLSVSSQAVRLILRIGFLLLEWGGGHWSMHTTQHTWCPLPPAHLLQAISYSYLLRMQPQSQLVSFYWTYNVHTRAGHPFQGNQQRLDTFWESLRLISFCSSCSQLTPFSRQPWCCWEQTPDELVSFSRVCYTLLLLEIVGCIVWLFPPCIAAHYYSWKSLPLFSQKWAFQTADNAFFVFEQTLRVLERFLNRKYLFISSLYKKPGVETNYSTIRSTLLACWP